MKNWIKTAGIRAVKTVAQTAIAMIGTSEVLGDVDWVMVASAASLAGILSQPSIRHQLRLVREHRAWLRSPWR